MTTGKQENDLPQLAAPARRALAGVGIATLSQLARHAEPDIAALHGMGPNAMGILKVALKKKGLAFRKG